MSFPLGNVDNLANNIPSTQSVTPTTSITDLVSTTKGGTSLCGGISYLISDATASGITALTASELTISPSG
jgi:hypothetical protein